MAPANILTKPDALNLPIIGSTTRPPDWPATRALGAGGFASLA